MSEHKELMEVLNRIAKALETQAGMNTQAAIGKEFKGDIKLSLEQLKQKLIPLIFNNPCLTTTGLHSLLIQKGYKVKINSLRKVLHEIPESRYSPQLGWHLIKEEE